MTTKITFFMTTEDYPLARWLTEEFGMVRAYSLEVTPNLLIIPNDTGRRMVHPGLYNRSTPSNFKHHIFAEKDLREVNLVAAAKMEDVAILGFGRGMNLLHAINGGDILHREPVDSSKDGPQERSIFAQEGSELVLPHDKFMDVDNHRQYFDLDIVNSGNLYSEILCDEDEIIRGFWCDERLQMGFGPTPRDQREKDLFKTFFKQLHEVI